MYEIFRLTFSENGKTDTLNCYDLKELQVCDDYVKSHPECKILSIELIQIN